MNHGQRAAVLLALAKELIKRGSWCGETHLQKASFLLQSLCRVELDDDFILYKHGPFSFRLRDALTELTADGLLELVVRHPSYGPSLIPTEEAPEFLERFPRTMAKHSACIKFITDALGDRGVSELERLATAVYLLTNENQVLGNEIEELVRLKPHISYQDAKQAFSEARRMQAKAETLNR